MTTKEANERCKREAYELSKAVEKIHDIRERLRWVATDMGWDDTLIFDFDEALAKLSKVMGGTTLWALESDYRKDEIETLRSQADALEEDDRS